MTRGLAILIAAWLAAAAVRAADSGTDTRIERLNAAFLKHLDSLNGENAIAASTIRDGWKKTYRDQAPEGFVPDALAVLYPAYREALAAFDAGRSADVLREMGPLRSDRDPFLAANAAYFYARAAVDLGRFEEIESELASLGDGAALDAHTPYAPHVLFLRGFVQARNLKFREATETLAALRQRHPDAPEAVLTGARQLLLELERRETGGLEEVATVMQYVSDRLRAIDSTERVRQRQGEVLALLDKLIEEEEKKEQSGGGGGGSKSQKKPGGKKDGGKEKPTQGREQSEAPAGSGDIGDLHQAPKADPGEMWGKLPPTEREKILQSLRDRFPSRYRQLVEQYYRSLAEQK